ncbi:TPA: hypothetical protein ACH3X2_006694 [Trebouxia sp. C0005]
MAAAASIPTQSGGSTRTQPASGDVSVAKAYASTDRSGGQLPAAAVLSSTAAEGALNSATRWVAAEDAADLGGDRAASQSMAARGYFDLEEPGREAPDTPPADMAAGTLSKEEAPATAAIPSATLPGAANLASAQHGAPAQGIEGAVMVPQGDGGQMGSLQGQWGQMVQSQGIPAQGHVGRIARFQGYGNAAMPAQDVGNQLGQKPFPGSSYSHASGQADDASQPNLFSRLSLSAASLSQSVGSNTAGALSGSLATILEADHAVEDNWPDSNATWGSACSTAQRSTGHTPPVSHDSTADIGAHPAASTAGLAWGTAGGQSAFAAAGLPPRKKEGPESVFAKWDPDYQATAHQDLVRHFELLFS